MEFITWWFGTHYIASTIFTPGLTFAWCIFAKASLIRLVISFMLALGVIIS